MSVFTRLLIPRKLLPPGLVVLSFWRPLVDDMCVGRLKIIILFSFTVDKLQFEPPLRKETEAHSEMVMIKSLILHHRSCPPLDLCADEWIIGFPHKKGCYVSSLFLSFHRMWVKIMTFLPPGVRFQQPGNLWKLLSRERLLFISSSLSLSLSLSTDLAYVLDSDKCNPVCSVIWFPLFRV